jgi:CBS domain-containing protein
MKAQDLMTASPACCTPDDTVAQAARLMQQHDCGCLPVVEDTRSKRMAGTITDRDIAVRVVAEGKSSDTRVRDAMSADPSCCRADDDVQTVERTMRERQVRRVPVVDAQNCCVGIISQADLARSSQLSDREVERVVERISEPRSAPRASAGGRSEARS